MKINKETREGVIGQELPWLLAHITEKAHDFTVQLIDVNLLSLQPNGTHMGSYDDKWWPWDRILLFDGDGKMIGKVGQKNDMVTRREWLFWKVTKEEEVAFRESVEQAITRLAPDSKNIRYILHVENFGGTLTLHKLSKNAKDLATQIQQKVEEERQRTRKILTETD